jgi:hypothetical protein
MLEPQTRVSVLVYILSHDRVRKDILIPQVSFLRRLPSQALVAPRWVRQLLVLL